MVSFSWSMSMEKRVIMTSNVPCLMSFIWSSRQSSLKPATHELAYCYTSNHAALSKTTTKRTPVEIEKKEEKRFYMFSDKIQNSFGGGDGEKGRGRGLNQHINKSVQQC